MGKRKLGVLAGLLECTILMLLCLLSQYSSDYTLRLLILYLICQILFGHYLFKTVLIWDEIRLLLLSNLCFFLTSMILIPIKYFSILIIVENLLITAFLFVFDVFITRALRLVLNKRYGDQVMIIGTGKEAKALANVCGSNRFSMMNVKCIINPGVKSSNHEIKELSHLSNLVYPMDELRQRLSDDKITEVILAEPELDQKTLDLILNIVNQYVRKIKYVPRIKDLITFDSSIVDFDGLLVISRSIENREVLKSLSKRLMDICCGMIGCLLILPLTLYVRYVNHKNGDYGPVYFKQKRIGKDGIPFVMYKFRTMIFNAEETLNDIMEKDPAIREEYTMNKKLRNDPRITKAGEMLRRRSLDEFPQFINVLKGNMSIVGPRPYLPQEKEDMGVYYQSIISSKPGITGMWQTHGRNDIRFKDRCTMDEYYYRNWSLWLDITILIKTFKSVFIRNGAL